jgi:hypothetical protein
MILSKRAAQKVLAKDGADAPERLVLFEGYADSKSQQVGLYAEAMAQLKLPFQDCFL